MIIRTVLKYDKAILKECYSIIEIGYEDVSAWKINCAKAMRYAFTPMALNYNVRVFLFPELLIVFITAIILKVGRYD